MRTALAITVIVLLQHTVTSAQNEAVGEAEAAAEILALSDEYNAEGIFENLAELRERPVLINSGDEEEIARLFFLTEFQVKVLADYVTRNGPVVSVYEIALLPGFDRSTAMLAAPYLSLDALTGVPTGRGGSTTVIATSSARLPSGDSDEAAVRSSLRLRHKGAAFSYGLTAENDPGEPFGFRGTQGADFVSGHIMYEGHGTVSRIIAGDYSLRFGEGLVFSSSGWQGSRLVSPSFMTGRTVISPYSSTEENNFFRGAGCVLGTMTKGLIVFVSSNAIDARVVADLNDSSVYISNLVKGGLHDTESGKSARNSLTENIAGLHISAGKDMIRGGITASFTHFSLPFSAGVSGAESVYDFSGNELINLGIDLKAGTGKILLFSEAAWSFPGSGAITGGIRATPAARVTLNLTGRHYAPDYHTFHANSYRSGSSVSNEYGIAGNIHVEAARHLFLSAGADIYRIPWLRYRSSAPSTGSSVEFRSEYMPYDGLNLRLVYQASEREYDVQGDSRGVAASRRDKREQLTAMLVYSPSNTLRSTTRAGFCLLNSGAERGYMLCQDLALSFRTVPVRVWFRYALYSTDSYASRLYAWENDMLYGFSVPAMYGEGSRTALMVSWKPFSSLELRAKYSVSMRQEGLESVITRELRVQGKIVF